MKLSKKEIKKIAKEIREKGIFTIPDFGVLQRKKVTRKKNYNGFTGKSVGPRTYYHHSFLIDKGFKRMIDKNR